MYCPKCGIKNESESRFCKNCGEEFKHTESKDDKDANALEDGLHTKAKLYKKSIMKLSFVMVVLVAVLYLGSTIVFKSKYNESIIYLKDNELMIREANKQESHMMNEKIFDNETVLNYDITMEGGTGEFVKITSDGTKVFFLADIESDGYEYSGDLYCKEIEGGVFNFKDDGESVKIASNVIVGSMKILENGKLVGYIKDSQEKKLYINDMKDEIKIDRSVSRFQLAEDGKSVLYETFDDYGSHNLYVENIETNKRYNVDENINNFLEATPDLGKIYYKKENDEALYLKEGENDVVKLLDDVTYVEHISDEGEILFTRDYEEAVPINEIFIDDMAMKDKNIKEPNLDDFIIGYSSSWFYTYPEYDMDSYYLKQREYDEKSTRDNIRRTIFESPIMESKKDLYVYRDGKEEKITEDFIWVEYLSQDLKEIICRKSSDEGFEKIRMSELGYAGELSYMYDSRINDYEDILIYVSDREVQKISSVKNPRYISVEDGFKDLYLIQAFDGEEGLFRYNLETTEEFELIDTDVSDYQLLNNDSIVYFKYNLGKEVDMYLMDDIDTKKIAEDISEEQYICDYESNSIVCIENYNEDMENGDLVSINKSGKNLIADDVHSFYFRNNDDIIYIADYSLYKYEGELWEYRGNEDIEKVDDDVQGILYY